MMSCPVMEKLGGFRPWWCHGDSDFLLRALANGLLAVGPDASISTCGGFAPAR